MQYNLKRTNGETLELCVTYIWYWRQNSLCLPFGADKAVHQAASGAQTAALTPTCWRIYLTCSGTHRRPSWLFSSSWSGLRSLTLEVSLLVLRLSISVPSFVKEMVLFFFCHCGFTGSDNALAKKSLHLPILNSRWHHDTKGNCISFLYHDFLTLFLHFVETQSLACQLAGDFFAPRFFFEIVGWLIFTWGDPVIETYLYHGPLGSNSWEGIYLSVVNLLFSFLRLSGTYL